MIGAGEIPQLHSVRVWKFGELADNVTESVSADQEANLDRAVGLEHLQPETPELTAWAPRADAGFTRRFRRGQVLFGKRRAYQRKAAVADFDGVCSGDILVFEAHPERLLPELLIYVVRSDAFVDHALGTSAGSMSPRTRWRDLEAFPLTLPLEQVEQQRLAGILRSATAYVAATRVAVAAAESARRALLTEYFGDTRALPTGWIEVALGEEFDCRSGATPKRSEHERYFANGSIPWVKTLDLNEGVVNSTDECITPTAVAETSCRMHGPETVMVGMYGGFNQIGRTGILGIEAASNQAVCCLSAKPACRLIPQLVLYALQANRSKWRRVAASSRKDPNITKRDVEQFVVRAPADASRQIELRERIEEHELLVLETRKAFDAARHLEKALINRFVANEL
jgi:type I restriction enzyme, S subunit